MQLLSDRARGLTIVLLRQFGLAEFWGPLARPLVGLIDLPLSAFVAKSLPLWIGVLKRGTFVSLVDVSGPLVGVVSVAPLVFLSSMRGLNLDQSLILNIFFLVSINNLSEAGNEEECPFESFLVFWEYFCAVGSSITAKGEPNSWI
jgi:hypothetical protein